MKNGYAMEVWNYMCHLIKYMIVSNGDRTTNLYFEDDDEYHEGINSCVGVHAFVLAATLSFPLRNCDLPEVSL